MEMQIFNVVSTEVNTKICLIHELDLEKER